MSINTFVKVTVASFGALVASVAAYGAPEYKPANFGFKSQLLLSKLETSTILKRTGDSVVLYCQADVMEEGKAKHVNCYDKKNHDDLEKQASEALTQLPFVPAEVNGDTVPVRMVFRLALSVTGRGITATLIPNLGSMQSKYGRDYIAPQERLDISDWYAVYNRNSWINGEEFLDDGPLSRVAATVDESGKPSVVRALDSDRAFKRDANFVKSALKRSRFIPGFVGGKPVPMGYLAVVNYTNSNGEMVGAR